MAHFLPWFECVGINYDKKRSTIACWGLKSTKFVDYLAKNMDFRGLKSQQRKP